MLEENINDSVLNNGINLIFFTDNIYKFHLELFGNLFFPRIPILKLIFQTIEESIKSVHLNRKI